MSKLKDAVASAISALENELPRIHSVLEAWESHGPATSIARDELNQLKDLYENGVVKKRMSSVLEFCEDNEDDISRLENQEAGSSLRHLAWVAGEHYVERLHSHMNDVVSDTSDGEDSEFFSKDYAGHFIKAGLEDDQFPQLSEIRGALHRALEEEGNHERSPEQLLQDMIEDSYEDARDTRLFCRLFDFKPTLDGFEVYNVVPSDTGDEVPGYIGGEFSLDEYDCSQPENFVWVAFNQLGELCEEYNEEHNEIADNYDVFDDIDDTEEIIELKERIKQQARPIMNGAIDETHDKYGEYRDRVIASVRNKQDEYGLSDDVVSAFANHVTKNINALIKNVENEFSEENQFYNEDEWGVLRVY